MSGLDRLFPRFAAALDRLKGMVPLGYDLNLVLVNRNDAEAHIFIGSSDPRAVARALQTTIDNPGRVGIADAAGIKVDI